MKISEVIKSWKFQSWQVLSTIGVLTGVLSVCFSFLVVHTNLNNVLSRWGSDFKVNVYMTDAISEEEKASLEKEISEQKVFKSVKYFSKNMALDKFKTKLGFLGSDLVNEGNLDNPLPASFEATIDTGFSGFLEALQTLSEKLTQYEFVEDVSYGQNWVENYVNVVRGWQYIGLIIALILGAGALLLSAGTIRSSIFHRRDEIEIMELFGATRWMILKPFLMEGALLGFIAGVLSVLIVYITYSLLKIFFEPHLSLWNLTDILSFASGISVLAFILACAALGCAGSMIGVRQINTGWAAAERT